MKIDELHRVPYRPSEVMATVGASMAIYAAIRAFVGRGDNAIIVSPAYAIFSNGVIMSGGEPRPVPLARDGNRLSPRSRPRARRHRCRHADADRQQPVESHRVGHQRGRATHADGDRG